MKKSLLFLSMLLTCIIAYGQVGINTENPQGIFHIDPQKNTSVNTNVSDDVVVTKSGQVGIGMVNPQHALSISSSTAGAIKIADGNQGGGKVLSSDANGVGTWQNIQGGWFALLTGGALTYTTVIGERKIPFSGGEVSISGIGNVNVTAGTITVPYTGIYRISLFGTSLMNRSSGYYIAGFYDLRKNSAPTSWAPHSLGNTSLSSSTYVSYNTFMSLSKNDVLSLFSTESNRGYANGASGLTMLVEFVK
ncbi:hypothetical protein [Dysgonomonas sp. 520]|uniref:hypothetical protein n=1 Tax=Dysgonomonas sp. 520 TaxID=2302931 RepID=UPI0013D2A781|nr:hypothetical protein [Dysgonomonas sp. 520]NDW10771.1 hypothetical protein [Dysgonomonas sp. 520]